MENRIWTFFCGSGSYDSGYRPALRRYVCLGGCASVTAAVNGEGVGKNRLTLRLRERQIRLVDERGTVTDLRLAGIQPGDRITEGYAAAPAEERSWRITSVTPASGGIGANRGIVITAE